MKLLSSLVKGKQRTPKSASFFVLIQDSISETLTLTCDVYAAVMIFGYNDMTAFINTLLHNHNTDQLDFNKGHLFTYFKHIGYHSLF